MPSGYKNPFTDKRPPLPVPGAGPVPCRIMFIGERPGETEAKARPPRPFIGAAGRILDLALECAELDRSEVYLTNLVKTFEAHEKPQEWEIARDERELHDEIMLVNPDVIGLLGTYAVEGFLNDGKAHLDRTHGVPRQVNGFTILPMLHPANAIYSIDTLPLIIDDFRAARMCLEGKLVAPEDILSGKEKYEEVSGDVWSQVEAAVDTEGWRDRPWCLTVCSRPGTAMMIRPPRSARFKGRILLHNSLHDLGVLRVMGVEHGEFADTMVWAYLLQLEPQGLKDLAYRHAGMEMMSYEEMIGSADCDKALEFLHEVNANEWGKPEPYVTVEGGKAKVKQPQGINQRVSRILNDYDKYRSGERDKAVDPRLRWDGIDDYVKVPVTESLGEMPTATLDDVPYQRALRYACRDADATLRIAPVLEQKIHEMDLVRASALDHSVIPMFDRMQEVGIQLAGKEFWDGLELECERLMYAAKHAIYKETGWDINPDSGEQVAKLLYEFLGFAIPKLTDGGKRGSTKDKVLEGIAGKSPVIHMVLDYRTASKVRTSFVIPLRRRATRGERVHANFRLTRVVTGRPSMADPNFLAIPVRSNLGKRVREGVVAEPGFVLGDWDLNQIEMRFMAHESGDKTLVDLFNRGDKDVHTETAARMFSTAAGNVRSEQRYAAKRVGFGVITGITEYGLVDQMSLARAKRPDGEAWTLDDCALMIEEWFKMYPGAKAYMHSCRAEARATGMVRESVSGRLRYLPGVWSDKRWVREEAERQSHSHKISAGAAAIMKQAQAQVWQQLCKPGWTEPLLQVYDELLLEIKDDPAHREFTNTMVMHLLTTTTELRVPIKAGGGYGQNWSEAHG